VHASATCFYAEHLVPKVKRTSFGSKVNLTRLSNTPEEVARAARAVHEIAGDGSRM